MKRKEQILQRSLELYPPIYSSTREQDAFIQGAEWADETMLVKVCEWVKKHYAEYAHTQLGQEYLIEDLREAMGE